MDGTGALLKQTSEVARARSPARAPRWPRVLLLAASLFAHALLIDQWLRQISPATRTGSALIVSFITRAPSPTAPLPAPSPAPQNTRRRNDERIAEPPTSPRARPLGRRGETLAPVSRPEPNSRLRLFAPDGRLQVSDSLLDEVDRHTGVGRRFEYEVKGLREADAFLQRHPVLVYEPTRFDAHWKPDETLLSEILRKAVEASTTTVRIPIPGVANSKIECQIVLLAAGGGCGIVSNERGALPGDDPNTLNDEENRQCARWWDQIVGAGSQSQWRQTRDLYERNCRKPLDRAPTMPPKREGLPKEP